MAYALLAWLLVLAALVLTYRRHLAACWREPVLRVPVFILESDDWGAGPRAQAPALRRLANLLASARDAAGRPAMMTLGTVLGVIDRAAWRSSQTYAISTLAADEHADILHAMRDGIETGVFTPQLHGMEHYWPPALLRRAAVDEGVRRWLDDDRATTESLPDALQSRWIDGSILPSAALSPAEIERAVAEEATLFQSLFGAPPRVAVPNTFVWNDAVERAWSGQGVAYVVTPGTRYEARAADGRLVATEARIVNGDVGPSGMHYLVRDVYFEPARGHRPEQLLLGLAERARLGRPCLVETHRYNYLNAGAEQAFAALSGGLMQVTRVFPNVRFMSTAELGEAMATRDSAMIESRLPARFAVWVQRIFSLPRFRKLAWVTGLAAVLHGAGALAAIAARRGSPNT